jgi:hypothetical protein
MTLKPDQMEHPLPSRPAIDNPMVMFRHHPLCWRSETDRFALVWDFGDQGRRGAFGNCGRGMPTIGTRKERHGRHTNSVSATKAEGLTAIMHHASRFCSLGLHTHAVDPSVLIGVRQLAVQRIGD